MIDSYLKNTWNKPHYLYYGHAPLMSETEWIWISAKLLQLPARGRVSCANPRPGWDVSIYQGLKSFWWSLILRNMVISQFYLQTGAPRREREKPVPNTHVAAEWGKSLTSENPCLFSQEGAKGKLRRVRAKAPISIQQIREMEPQEKSGTLFFIKTLANPLTLQNWCGYQNISLIGWQKKAEGDKVY